MYILTDEKHVKPEITLKSVIRLPKLELISHIERRFFDVFFCKRLSCNVFPSSLARQIRKRPRNLEKVVVQNESSHSSRRIWLSKKEKEKDSFILDKRSGGGGADNETAQRPNEQEARHQNLSSRSCARRRRPNSFTLSTPSSCLVSSPR